MDAVGTLRAGLLIATLAFGSASLDGEAASAVGIPGRGSWETTLAPRDLDGDAATIEAWYDTDLGITWLADAGAAAGSVADAKAWAASLQLGGVGGWRLPSISDTASPGCDFSTNGSDCGYNVDLATGEMAHLYYATLANLAIWDTSGNHQPGFGLANTGPFTGLSAAKYWSSLEQAPLVGYAWAFDFANGGQAVDLSLAELRAWAVHDGDVGAPVPEPTTGLLVGAGLLGLSAARRASHGSCPSSRRACACGRGGCAG